MLKIRFSRFGTKNRPTYRLTVAEQSKDARGKVLEYLGSYNARSNPKFIQLNAERIKFWLSQGAQASPSVHNLLVSQKIVEGKKVKAWNPKKPASPNASQGGKEEAKKVEVKAETKAEEKVKAPKAEVEKPKEE